MDTDDPGLERAPGRDVARRPVLAAFLHRAVLEQYSGARGLWLRPGLVSLSTFDCHSVLVPVFARKKSPTVTRWSSRDGVTTCRW